MHQRSVLAPSVLVLGGALLTLGAQRGAANVYGSYSSNSNFTWRVTNMTDIDQRRSVGGSRPGLPFDGAMYCVPTATINVSAYIANHGYPFVLPGAGDWSSSSVNPYNTITNLQFSLGGIMGTDPDPNGNGTGGSGNLAGNLFLYNGYFFDVVRKHAASYYAPTANEIGLMGLQGALLHLGYGRYDYHVAGNPSMIHLDARTGGHAVTATRVSVSGSNVTFKYRDPSTDKPANSFQSPFENEVISVTNKVVERNGVPVLMSDMNINTGGQKRFIDSCTGIFPRYGITNYSGGDGGAQSLQVIIPQPLRPLVGVQTRTYAIPSTIGPILDVAVSPDRLHYLFLADDFQGDGFGFTSGLFRVDPFTGDVTRLMGITNPRRMAFSRFPNEIFVAETRTLHRIDLSTTPPTIVQQHTVAAGLAIDALAFAPDTDEVLALSGFDDVILRYRRTTIGTEPPATETLPAGATFLAGKMFLDVSPVDGSLGLGCDASTTIVRLTRVTDSYAFQSSFTAPSAPRGLHIDDTGQYLLLGDGSVRTFRRVVPAPGGPGAWQEQQTPWNGVSFGTMLNITRSVSDDANDEEGPAFRNLTEAEIVQGAIDPGCPGDANQDDFVDFLDLNIVLSEYGGQGMWLEGDVDDDGFVGFTDLNHVLSAYGLPCP